MKILAFDTCFDACSVAVAAGDGAPVIGARELMRRGHAEALMPMIDRVMDQAGLAFGDLDRIAVTHGPGTFTGTRLAVIARAAARALDGRLTGLDGIAVVRDARRANVYLEVCDTEGRPLAGPRLADHDDAIRALDGQNLFAFGSGLPLLAERAGSPINGLVTAWPLPPPDAVDEPDARYLIDLAATLDASLEPAPLYLRPPDAKLPGPSPIAAAARPAAGDG